jgi:tRNA (adenine58-N1)-methyltransferase non-catalytic subunit
MIREGDTVIVRMHDDESSHMLMVKDSQKLFKKKVNVESLVGAPYGSVFEVTGTELIRVQDSAAIDLDNFENTQVVAEIDEKEDNSKKIIVKGDNSYYNDTNTAQKLTVEEIHKLKEDGASGSTIIQSLIANSDTWNSKTEFAQEKWLKRKQKRYIKRIRIIESTPLSLCEVYHTKSRDKICGLRHDSLAHILSHSGVYAGAKVLLVESCIGLLVGTFAQRMQGAGKIFAVYAGQQPHFELVDALNLNDDATSIIQPLASKELGSASADVRKTGLLAASDMPVFVPQAVDQSQSMEVVNNKITSDNPDSSEEPAKQTRSYNSTGRKPEVLHRTRHEIRCGVNSLVIACRYNVLPILKKALHLLAPSSPLVLYCEFVEPLIECYMFLVQNSLAIRMLVSDTWMREFQTLPGRVHPQMYMSTSSGFILSGIYVGGVEKIDCDAPIPSRPLNEKPSKSKKQRKS